MEDSMKQKATIVVLLLSAVFAVAQISSRYVRAQQQMNNEHDGDGDDSRIQRGFAIAPVPLHYNKKNRELVGLGSYIVNAQGGCNDCHTNPPFKNGGDPYVGQPEKINTDAYLTGGQAFGPFISRNLTPDAQGLPAGMTFKKFLHTLRTGEDDDKIPPRVPSEDHDLLQIMPWPVYGKMNDHDIQAIYEYLKAIPPRPGYPQ
jgi:hypothetical protein